MMNGLLKLLLTCILFFTSCSQIKYIDIQVLKPADFTPDPPIQRLVILKSARLVERGITQIDTGFNQLFFNALYDSIESKLNAPTALYHGQLSSYTFTQYKKKFAEISFAERRVSYIVDLEKITLKDSVYTDIDVFLGQNDQLISQKVGIHQVKYAISFSVRNMALEHVNKTISLSDTLEWVSSSTVIKNKTAHYHELAEILAVELMEKIVPHWHVAERRVYFVPNQLMRKAYKYFVDNQLQAAINQWEVVYTKGTRPLASKAAFNIALSYELMDELQMSKEWINKAISVKNDSVFVNYQQLIEKRIEEQAKIDKQLWK